MQKDTMGHKALPQDRQFYLPGPFGPLPVIITYGATEEARRRVFVMAHGFRGSMDGEAGPSTWRGICPRCARWSASPFPGARS